MVCLSLIKFCGSFNLTVFFTVIFLYIGRSNAVFSVGYFTQLEFLIFCFITFSLEIWTFIAVLYFCRLQQKCTKMCSAVTYQTLVSDNEWQWVSLWTVAYHDLLTLWCMRQEINIVFSTSGVIVIVTSVFKPVVLKNK